MSEDTKLLRRLVELAENTGGSRPGQRPIPTCSVNQAIMQAPDAVDFNGLIQTAENGRFPFKEKAVPGYWPIIEGIAAFANPAFLGVPIGTPGIRLQLGFNTAQPPVISGAGTPVAPVWIIFDDMIPVPVGPPTPSSPSVLNTNWGRGWPVPHVDGKLMDFFAVSDKQANVVGLTLHILWKYRSIEEL